MKKIWKGLLKRSKLLSIVFGAISIACLATVLTLNLTVKLDQQEPDNNGDNVSFTHSKSDYDAMGIIEAPYLEYTTYATAASAPDGKTAGTWLTGINVTAMTSGWPTYLRAHQALVVPHPSDTTTEVVGIDLATNGYKGGSATSNQYIQAITLIEKIVIPKSVKYITEASFYGFSKLGYLEIPFVGTERGSSGKGMDLDITTILSSTTPTSDSFGSMFSLPNPNLTVGAWSAGSTDYWYHDTAAPQGAAYYQPRNYKWREHDDGVSHSDFFTYQIPDKIDFLYITDETRIGNYALNSCSAKHVEITASPSVKNDCFVFGNYAFAESGSLPNIGETPSDTGKGGLEEIKLHMKGFIDFRTGTFDKCELLKKLTVPYVTSNLTLPEAFLNQALSLEQVFIPGTVTSIGDGAFKGCEKLERISVYTGDAENLEEDYDEDVKAGRVVNSSYKFYFPQGLKTIGMEAFNGCKSLDVIYVPNTVTQIGYNAYGGCTKVTKAILPFVGAHAGNLNRCNNLNCTDSTKDGKGGKKTQHGLFGWIFGNNAGADQCYTAREQYIDTSTAGNPIATASFTIPNTLTEVTITNETHLTTGCFQGLSSLTSVTINDAVSSNIVNGCFDQCGSLEMLSIPYIVGGNLGALFQGTDTFDGSVGTIGSNYRVPSTLTNVRVTNMPNASGALFHECRNVKTVEFSEKTTSFGHGIFHNNQSLETLVVPFVGIGRGEFYGDWWWWWRDRRYRNNLLWLFSEDYQTGTYRNTSQLYYDSYGAYIPSTLKHVTVTDETCFGEYSFQGFTSLTSISITNTPDYIAEYSFWNCGSLNSLQLPYIGNDINKNGYGGRSHVLGWIFGRSSYGNSYAATQAGTTYYIPKGLETVEIGTSSTSASNFSNKIFDDAFRDCSSIVTVDFNNAVIDALGNGAFANCTKLNELIYPNARYTHVGNSAFLNCKNVKRMKSQGEGKKGFIPDTVKTIGSYGFAGTSVGYKDSNEFVDNDFDLTSYTSLGDYAFSNCLQINSVEMPNNVTYVGTGLFADCSYLADVNLINKNVSPYMFKNCVSLEGIDFRGINDIPAGVFQGCSNLSFAGGLQLDPTLYTIGDYSFAGCKSLESDLGSGNRFELPPTLKSIGKGAFQQCKSLDHMTIPKETTVIDPEGWIGCDDNFYFWVYNREEKWPKTWVKNWNCDYPVYVLGDDSEEIFTYSYRKDEKKYYITGITKEAYDAGLSGLIRIPASHNGVAVVGINETWREDADITAGAQNIGTQIGITGFIIPKGVTKIYGSPFQTGARVDIYTEYTEAEILKIYEDSLKQAEAAYVEWENAQTNPSDTDKQNKKIDLYGKIKGWKPFSKNSEGIALAPTSTENFWDVRNWTSGGMLYYYDYWRYGTGVSATVPFLRVEKLKFTFDEYELLDATFKGTEIEVPVVQIQLPGELFINDALDLTVESLMYVYQSDVDIMNYDYSNNINVGTANVNVTVNNTRLNNFNASYADKERYPLRLLGQTTLHYQIQPIEIVLTATANEGMYYDKTYDGSPFRYNQWQSGQITGLEGFPGAVFTGTISTPSANANNAGHPEYLGSELVWSTPWRVLLNNIDVSKNFKVTVLFSVIINPMEVELVWSISDEPIDGVYQTAELEGKHTSGKDVYLYPYIGGKIYPKAIAKKHIPDNGKDVEYVPDCKMYVTIPGTVGVYPYAHTPDYYYMYGGITSACSNNYVLVAVDDSGNKYYPEITTGSATKVKAVDAYYKIINGRVVIDFDITYLLSPTENRWSYTWGVKEVSSGVYDPVDTRTYIKGLGANSRFVGQLATSGDAKTPYNYPTSGGLPFEASGPTTYLLSWQTVSFGYSGTATDGSGQTYTVNFTADADNPYRIWNPVLGLSNENEFYDLEVHARVDIKYNTFEPTWFIGLNGADYETIKYTDYVVAPDDIHKRPTQNVDGLDDTRTYYYWQYEVDGQEYRFSVEDLDVIKNNYPNYEVLYYSGNGQTLNDQDVTFTELGNHVFSVTLRARHYDTIQYNIWIEAVKSHVQIGSLTKVYDREPVDLLSCIKKIGDDQRAKIKVTYMDQYGTELVEQPPVNVGKYKAHIVIPEGTYFHEYDEVLDFEILPRPIVIDVQSGPEGAFKTFDNHEYQIDVSKLNLNTTASNPNSGLLSGDVIQGFLQTSSFIPGEYDSKNIYDANANGGNFAFRWAANWVVTYVGTFEDVSKNYEVVLKNSFEIKPLEFEYTVFDNFGKIITDTDAQGHLVQNIDFDSKIHYIRIDVTYPMPGNYFPAPTPNRQILYSDQPLSENSTLWLNSSPTCVTPGEHKIYYMIKADYFKTIIDYVTINISELIIEYTDPATLDGDGFDSVWTVEYDGAYHDYEIIVTKPSFSSTVYYSVDGGAESQVIPSFREPGEYKVKYRITAPNYEEVVNEVTVRITQPGEPIPESKFSTNYFKGVYDGNPHQALGEFDASWLAAQPAGFWTHVLYSDNEGKDWTEFPYQYTEIGQYPVWIKFQAKGYQDQIVKDTVVIKGKPLSLTTSPVELTFDNKYHNVDLVATGGATVTQDPDTGVWTYTDPTCPSGVELELSYSLDANVAHADAGWIKGKGYKDVGTYPIYLKVEGENFEPLIFENYTELKINFLENPTATMDSPQIFEYSKSPLDVSQLEIDTVADGVRTAYWYTAHINPGGDLEQDLPAEPTGAPQELGVYYVEVRISASKNTGKVTVSGFVQIVPRKLTVKWDSPQYYDGTLKNPNAYVETGTSDSISLIYSVQGTSQPIDVGSYIFDVSMANPNPNYVLDRSTFTLEIIKRNILFKLDEEHVVKDGYAKWVSEDSEFYDTSDQCPGDDHWHLLGDLHGIADKWDSIKGEYVEVEYAGLAPNHMMYVELETSAGVRGEYHYSTITNEYFINSVKILNWDIYEKDGSGNIVTDAGKPVSVKDYYDVDFDIIVKLTNPKIDLSNLEMTTEYVYDGLPHAIYFNIPTSYGGAYVYYKDDKNHWSTTPLRRTFVGEYPVEYYVGATGYEDTYGTAILKITPADLSIEIGDMYKKGDTTKALHEKYDDTAHLNQYTVTNLKCDPIPSATHIRYYDATTCTDDDIYDLYRNFSEDSALYKSGIPELIDAGKYYCVVYYEEDTNRWHRSFAVKEVTLLPRNIIVEFPAGSMADIRVTYNGNPVVIPLANATIDTTLSADGLDGLLSKHQLSTTPEKMAQYFVQTNSANAGKYPLDTGFDFLAIDIKDASTGKPVKISNYHPVLKGDFYVEILKKYLEDYEFYLLVNEYIKEYDGKIHNTNYFTDGDYFCASDGEQILTFTELVEGGGRVPCIGPQKNAGVYEVVLAIDEGTNYYSSYASASAYKDDGTPFLSYPTVKYTVTCTPKVVEVEWDKLEQRFNGEVLAPIATFVDAETDPKNPVDVQLKITYFDNDARAFIPKNIVNAGSYLALAGFDTTTAKGRDYAKNYHLETSTLSEKFIVTKLTLTLQLGDGGESNKITYYSSSSPWWTYIYKTPTPNAAEFLAEGDAEAQAWIDKMVISSLSSADGIPTVSTVDAGGDPDQLCRTYSDYYDFEYNIRIKTPTGLDVTDSIEYRIKDSVTIVADEIVYELTTPIEVLYREAKGTTGATGYNLAELNCLQVKNPKKYSIDNYRINGSVASTTDRITDAGVYTLTFDITAENRTPRSVEVEVTILQRSSYMIFTKDLSKVYDASPVDAMTLVDMNLSGFNGSQSDLVFTYYEIGNTGSETLLTEAPTNVGNYRVHIISNADTDPSVHKNYTTLDIDRTFSITPKPIDLVYELDLELEDDSKLGLAWDVEKGALAGDVPGVFSGDKMQYAFHLDSLARGDFIGKKSFPLSNNYTQQSFTTDGGTIFQFAWVVYDANDDGTLKTQDVVVSDGMGGWTTKSEPIDISKNYQVNLSFRLLVHYPYIPFEINGIDTPYDGANHHGSLVFGNDKKGVHDAAWYQANVLQYYSESADGLETSTINSINHPNITKSEPGTYTIYYLLKVNPTINEKYEEARGSFIITITKLERELTVISPTKDYDGIPAGKQYTGATTTRWFPDHTIAPRAYPDTFDYDDVVIRYLLGKKEVDASTGCIESGTYSYSIKLPETKYYKETLATGIFYINRIKLFVEDDTAGAGPASYTYDSMVKTFDFNYNPTTLQQNPQSNYLLYTMVGGTPQLLSTNNLLFRAELVTNNKEVGTYKGSDGSLTVFAYEYQVYDAVNQIDVTNNYVLDIAKASISIENREMKWSTEDAVYIYDSDYHDFIMTFTSPSRDKVTIQYYDGKVWQTTPIRYKDCGDYECKVRFLADNYAPIETTVKMTIKRAPTEVLHVTGLGKTYDGAEVTLPEEIFTNRDLADEENLRNTYTYEYFRYDPTTGTYSSVPMFSQTPVFNSDGTVTTQHVGDRPIDVGQYKIRIYLPQVQNFEDATYEAEFIIGQRETTVNWVGSSFVYDGTPKSPEAFMKLTPEDIKHGVVVKLKYTYEPNGAPNDDTHTAAGFYTAKVSIDYDNSSPKSQNYKIDLASESYPFRITKRPIEIKFSKQGVFDDDALHQYMIKHDLSTEVNPSTTHLFTVNNLVTGHVMKDYLQVLYNGTRIYNTVDDFEWHNYLTNDGLASPRIFDALGAEVQDNYLVVAHSYLFELTTDASALQRELIPFTGEYDGDPHTFTFNLIGADKNDYLISYKITVLSGGNGVTGTGNHFISSSTFLPDHQPTFIPVGEYLIEVKISDLSGNEICVDPVTVKITQADPDLKPADATYTLGKVYDGVPVENPEMDYKGKTSGDSLVKYTYYALNPITGDHDILLASNPKTVGEYKLVIDFLGNNNYKPVTYPAKVFQIKPREITITVPPTDAISSKLYNYQPWSTVIPDTYVNAHTLDTGLATNQTLYNPISSTYPKLVLTKIDAGTYHYSTNPTDFYFDDTSSSKCKIFDEFNQEVQDNYVFNISANIQIKQREFVYDFDPLISKFEKGKSYFVEVNIRGTVEPDGSVGPIYVNSNDIQILYSLDAAFTNPSATPIPITTSGHHLVWAKITAGNNYKPILTYAPVYLYEDDDDDIDDKPLPTDPSDAEKDPTNVTFDKYKVYDSHPYGGPTFIGHQAEDRKTDVIYYTYEYYKDCKDKGIPLDPDKAINAPIDVGDYVFIFDIEQSPDGTDPSRHYEQIFRVKPRPVKVEWDGLIAYIKDGKIELDTPTYPTAKYRSATGTYEPMKVGPNQPGETKEGTYIVNAYLDTPNPNYKFSNLNEVFEITRNPDLVPKPNDAEDREDIEFDKTKVYDTHPYNDPIFKGDNAANRIPTFEYYTWDYYNKNKGVLNTADQLGSAPINVGAYVFVMHIPANPADPTSQAEEVRQYFTVTPYEVTVTWGPLTFVHDGTEHKPTATFVDIETPQNTVSCNVTPGYNYVGKDLPVMALSPDPNYSILNPHATITITGTEIDPVIIAPGQELEWLDPLILHTTGSDPDYYVSKDDYDKDNTIIPISDWSKVFLVDNNGMIYKWDTASTTWVDAQRPYTMKFDVDKHAGTHTVTTSLKDKTQTSWKGLTADDLTEDYEITPLDVKNSTEWDIEYSYKTIWPYDNGKAIEPPVEIILRNRLVPTRTEKLETPKDFTLTYDNNKEPTDKAEIRIQGEGDYTFSEIKYFTIIKNRKLLELKADADAAWIEATINDNGEAVIVGEDDGTTPVAHDEIDQPNMYLGRLHQETTIENILKQFVGYDEKPTEFVVKKRAETPSELADPDIDVEGFIPIPSADYATMNFANGMKVCLLQDQGDGTMKVVDEAVAILHGDLNNDGVVNFADLGSVGGYIKENKTFNQVTKEYFFAGIVDRAVPVINLSTVGKIGAFTKDKTNDFNEFGTIYTGFYKSVE